MADAYNDDFDFEQEDAFAIPAHKTSGPGAWSTPTPATTKIPPAYDGRKACVERETTGLFYCITT
eukprot:1701305-Amphidinium_carterae.1